MLHFTRKLNLLAALLLLGAMTAIAGRTPRPLLDITIDGPGAKRYRPLDARGKIRLIALLSNHCDPCTKTAAILNRIDRQYKPKGVMIFGALVNAYEHQDLTAYLKLTNPVYPMGMLTKENTMRIADFNEEDRPFAPILLFVNQSNTVTYQLFGNEGADSEQVISAFLDKMLQAK
jgi:hypothetical protein